VAGSEVNEDRAYWAGHSPGPESRGFPLRPTSSGASWLSASVTGAIDAALVSALEQIARQQHTTISVGPAGHLLPGAARAHGR